jgi:hypothetical protein
VTNDKTLRAFPEDLRFFEKTPLFGRLETYPTVALLWKNAAVWLFFDNFGDSVGTGQRAGIAL